VNKLLLANFRKVLESEALSRSEIIGFLVALFIEEDGHMQCVQTAKEARALLARLTPLDHKTRGIWLEALSRMDVIYKFPAD